MFKKENGITLVALVVTIVVLLILAGVSISLVLGQNGLVNRAKEAADATNKAATSENTSFQQYDNDVWFNTLVNGMN
mgnify:FL=1